MSDLDLSLHSRGEARFVADLPEPEGLLRAAVLASPVAHGRITRLDASQAAEAEGVAAVLLASDVPGENQIGTLVPDEPLLACAGVHYAGQPVALVIAASERQARAALRGVLLQIDELPAITDPREAQGQGELIVPPRTFCLGEVEAAWKECDLVVEGRVESGGQEHLYLETQSALALPGEDGGVKVYSATQSPTGVQRAVARVLGVPMHKVEVEVPRLGGAFGGKEDQATAWAALAALGAVRLGRPVKLVLSRPEDLRFTGKRHPYSSDYRLGLSYEGRLLAYEVSFYQNAGAAADLSPAILERTLFHCTGSYFVPNVKATAYSCRTNLPPNTAFRGFGGPQGMFVMEAAVAAAAEALGREPGELQEKNLLQNGSTFPYGMIARDCHARRCWQEATAGFGLDESRRRVEEHNRAHALSKKGLALMPVCFGISFTNTVLNQGAALVHVYTDGSVSASTGAVEMGQGVKAKIQEVAARVFGIHRERVRVESTSTLRVANTSPTAASTGTDLNGKATEIACRCILERLKAVAAAELRRSDPAGVEIRAEQVLYKAEPTTLIWEKLIPLAYSRRVSLSAQAHYATPGIHFDKRTEKGEPFSYHAYGTGLAEVTLDCLRGTYQVDSVRVVHDLGPSLAPHVDLGQAEGGIVQGIGWLTCEEVLYSPEGRLLTGTLSTYKVPDIYHTPLELEVRFLEDTETPAGVFNAKAIGEPPFMYGIAVYFALRAAIRAARRDATGAAAGAAQVARPEAGAGAAQVARPEAGAGAAPAAEQSGTQLRVVAPLTPERVLMSLYGDRLDHLPGLSPRGCRP